MSNIAYCRMENTYYDLAECYENLGNNVSQSEIDFEKKIIVLCEKIIEKYKKEGKIYYGVKIL